MIKRIYKTYCDMSEPLKASIWYSMCSILNKGIALISTPIFTRVMSEEDYGSFAIFQSWYGIILIFTSMNVFLSGYQKGLLLFKNEREKFTSSQLGLTTLLTGIFCIIYLCNIKFWTKILEISPVLMIAMFIELFTMPALELWASSKRFDYKYKKYVFVSLAMSFFSVFGGVIAVLNNKSKLAARVYTDVGAKSAFAIILFIIIFYKGKTIYDKKFWKYAICFNLPLIPHYLANYVLGQSDRIMISKMIGNKQAAFYSVAYTISTIMLIITNAINDSLVPYIYKKIEKNECDTIENIIKPIVFLMAGLCVMTMAFAPEVILIFAGKKYMDAIYVIPPIACSVYFIFVYSLYITIEYYYQKTKSIALATTISAILNLLLNTVCIEKFGYYAAGYTTLFCYICLAVMHHVFYKAIIKESDLECKKLYNERNIFFVGIFTIIIMLIMVVTYKITIIRYMIILFIIICLIVKRRYLLEILKGIKEK